MTDKIRELTEKIYNEGVVKAKEDADHIISEAKKEANKILESANKQKAEIIKKANKETQENKKNINSEIQLATLQFTSNLKQQITNSITTRQIQNPIKESFQDINFVKKIILTTVQNWNPQKSEELDLKILLPEEDKNEFTDFLNNKTVESLNKGVKIEFDSKTKNGFKIGPQNGNYIISFEGKDFENYFKKYFRQSTKKLLFDSVD